MLAFNLSLFVVSVLVLIPVLVVSLECLLALFPRKQPDSSGGTRPRIAVLIPAHNEEEVIEATLNKVLSQVSSEDTVLVIADNCNDRTAQIGRDAGATVAERRDHTHRGKGHALAFGRDVLSESPPDVVVVVDADCHLASGALARLAECAHQSQRPTQAAYTIKAPPDASHMQRLAHFAVVVKNTARPLGAARLGLPCQLAGSGMAFPWAVFERAPLASSHLVEDLELGLHLSSMGHPPLFHPEAQVSSFFPGARDAQQSQRKRWEHGHLSMMVKAPRFFVRAARSASIGALFLVVDLLVPPLSLLVFLLVLQVGLATTGVLLGARPEMLLAGLGGFGLLALSIGGAWIRFGRHFLPARILLAIPLFLVLKIPLYVGFLFRRQRTWVKTGRRP